MYEESLESGQYPSVYMAIPSMRMQATDRRCSIPPRHGRFPCRWDRLSFWLRHHGTGRGFNDLACLETGMAVYTGPVTMGDDDRRLLRR